MTIQAINPKAAASVEFPDSIHQHTRNPFRIARAAWRTIRDPADTRSVTILEDVFMRSRWLQRHAGWDYVARHLGKTEHEFLAMPRPPQIRPAGLIAECAEGTLGYVLGKHFIKRGLNPNIFADQEVTSASDAIRVHLIGTHDIWHVVTGFDNDMPGEFGVVAFTCAQTRAPISTLLLAVALLNTALFEHSKLAERFEAMVLGWQLGQAAQPLFGIDWASHWHRDFAELREELGVPHTLAGQRL